MLDTPPKLKKLTRKQEKFAQLVAAGESKAEAYRQVYKVGENTSKHTVWVDSYALAKLPHVARRIESLTEEYQVQEVSAVGDAINWSARELASEALVNVQGARASNQWSASNSALRMIGELTGILNDKAQTQTVSVTKVTIVTNSDTLPIVDQHPALEAETRELPPATEQS